MARSSELARSALSRAASSTSEPVLIHTSSLREWFHEALDDACRTHGFGATPASGRYVASLLDQFSDADQLFGVHENGKRKNEALAMMLHEAVLGEPTMRLEQFRRMGDVALYVAGVFSDSLRRRSVDVTYYIHMGQGAYGSLSSGLHTKGGAALKLLYEELADTFSAWVEVLRAFSEQVGLAAPLAAQDTADLYERLGLAHGRRADEVARALLLRGALPTLRPGLGGA